jgi:hypothetical protein
VSKSDKEVPVSQKNKKITDISEILNGETRTTASSGTTQKKGVETPVYLPLNTEHFSNDL